MSHRSIGQERLGFVGRNGSRSSLYALSDVKLTKVFDDGVSYYHFRGFSKYEATCERPAFAQDRKLLVGRRQERLHGTVTAQLKPKAVTVKADTLVDAAIVVSTSERDDSVPASGILNFAMTSLSCNSCGMSASSWGTLRDVVFVNSHMQPC